MAPSDYTDSHGRRLADYPRPSVAVDTALLTVVPGEGLCVALVGSGDGWRLPGTFVHEGETLADAVRRSLRNKAGITGLRPRQLHVFDAPDRDERGWVMSVAHVDTVPFDGLEAASGVSFRSVDRARGLLFDHDRIVELAVERLRAEYRGGPDPSSLIAEPFTLRDLLQLHSAIDPETPDRDSFRRRMLPHLVETGERKEGVVGKPPRLFRKLTGDNSAPGDAGRVGRSR